MELVVVIAILALSAAIVIPLLPASDSANLKNSARKLATLVRYLGERSVTTKTGYRLVVDLNGSRITVKKMVGGEEATPEDPFLSRSVLAEGVGIEDVELQGLGKVSEGSVNVEFGFAGLGEFMAIHLKGAKGDHFTVTALPGGGRVETLEGYQEMTR
jgi:Tfp pilus assembly protein FimT